ncbi:hypothetical protein CWI39_0561p0040 [Hamiltosporidium magnivora]|uniref:Uncharacterized protein n=1 Tax=Hamiltosporidium magnivora TaxID=148818 RepID=A0A4V2JW28_9MICR|nr:hypothetical protein CWI39_0561p0040 [Hamiltosporidium magnivora]
MKDCIEQFIRELLRPFKSYEKKKFYTRGAYSMSLMSLMSADEDAPKQRLRSKKSKTKSSKSKKKKSSKQKTVKDDRNVEFKKSKGLLNVSMISNGKPMQNESESVSTLGKLFKQDFTPNVKLKKTPKTKKDKKHKKSKNTDKEEDYSLLLKEYESSATEKKAEEHIITPFDDKSLSDQLQFPLSEYFSPTNKPDEYDNSAEEDISKKDKKQKKSKKKINLKIKDMNCQEDSSDFNIIDEKISMGLKEYLNNIK